MHVISQFDHQITVGKIVETEAYKAPEDKASHAFGNKRTSRTEVMFGPAGSAYVYLCYGIHHMFNIVSGPEQTAHAILIRAIEPILGIDIMLERRSMNTLRPQLTAGPGVLTKALGIHKRNTGLNLFDKESPIWLSEAKDRDFEIIASPRVGIDYAEEWIDTPWRFRIKDHPYCSKAR